MLAKALARSIDCSVRRVQFTPDLLPSDITGVNAYNQELREFEFKPGPVFANIVVGDEINRASPKTQSALLECMEERQVTVDGTTYLLEAPFLVIATQNPIEMEGTYPLPEAQRDRFTARISMGYPTAAAELEMLDTHGSSSPLDQLKPVATAVDVRELIAAVRGVLVTGAGEGVHHRAGRGHQVRARAAARRLAAGRAPAAARVAGPGPRSTAGTTSSPTTSRPSPSRCSRTGCCRPPRRWSSGTRPSRWSPGSSRRPRCRSPDGGLTRSCARCSGR